MTATAAPDRPAQVRVLGALAVVGMLAATACSASTTPVARTSRAPAAAAGFGWFRPAAAPADWRSTQLPDRTALLAYPATARPVRGDPGTVSVMSNDSHGVLALYLNATPRQGAESLTNWAHFRVDHLTDDDARTARLVAAASGLRFRGGRGSCVIDDYTTRVGAHPYREIACYVSGPNSASVLVAATLAVNWAKYRGILEQAVDAYALR